MNVKIIGLHIYCTKSIATQTKQGGCVKCIKPLIVADDLTISGTIMAAGWHSRTVRPSSALQVWVDERLTIELDTRSQLDIPSSDCLLLLSLSILLVRDLCSCVMPADNWRRWMAIYWQSFLFGLWCRLCCSSSGARAERLCALWFRSVRKKLKQKGV